MQGLYEVKRNANGSMKRYKATIFAKGMFEHMGQIMMNLQYCCKDDEYMIVITLARSKGQKLWKMDVKSVFFNGRLKEEVYMQQLECYVQPMYLRYV